MLKRLPPLLWLMFFSTVLPAQSPGQAVEQGLLELRQSEGEPEAEAVANFRLAQAYSQPESQAHNPDTAYAYLLAGQRLFRRLDSREQRRVERKGFSHAEVRSLKNEIREQGLAFSVEKGSSQAMLDYMEHYSRLPTRLSKQAMPAFLQLRFDELQTEEMAYDSLRAFAQNYRDQISEYLPELNDSLQQAAVRLYFRNRDSTNIFALVELLKEYPKTVNLLDGPMSQALQAEPYITQAENLIRGLDHRYLPKTIKIIYLYHYYTGDWSDLIGFQNRYPFYTDSFNLQRALTVAQSAPNFKQQYTKEQEADYERYIKLGAPTHKAYAALLRYLSPELENKNWKAALTKFERFAPSFAKDSRIDSLRQILLRPSENLSPVNLGSGVNTIYKEYAPVISADGQRIYFCRNQDNSSEDIFVAEKQDSSWGTALPLSSLNTPKGYQAPLSVSTDGATLLYYDGGQVKYAERQAEGWSSGKPFFSSANEPDWQGMTTLSSDGQTVIFAARSIQCVGARNHSNIDLFIAHRQPDGQWGTPRNLGPAINTPFEDRSPFLHPDQRTLYFSSDGHGGLGELDVFVTRRIGNGWDEWTTPVNLGKDINSIGNDWGYRISTDGQTAYFSRHETGWEEELSSITVPEAYRPEQVSSISGTLTQIDGKPANAVIIINDLETGEEVGRVKPAPGSGDFFIPLPTNRRYSYTVEGDSLYPVSNNIDLRGVKEGSNLLENIIVPTIAQASEGQLTLPIKNLFFDTDSHRIDPASFAELDRLAELVQANELKVEIAGHTDNQGGEAYNRSLSQKRAEAARDYLIRKGCSADRVSARGYGMSQPLASNETEVGRAKNRRVELRFEAVVY